MPTIAAANNLTIRAERNNWALLNGRADDPTPIVEASPAGLSYRPTFGTARRLSPEGRLPADQITMVVVGWAVEDSSWHLGLMVAPELAQTRGGRWCGLARWDNADGPSAAQAGETLASTLNKPFRLVPPPDNAPVSAPAPPIAAPSVPSVPAQPAPPTTPEVEVPSVPLMVLPITSGEWTLEGNEDGLLWERSKGWRNKTLLNAGFFGVLTIIFGALSLGARLSAFAPVQPDWLPIVGIGLTLLMIALLGGQLLALSRATVMYIDNHQRLVRVMRGYRKGKSKTKSVRTLVQSPYEGIEYVLVSHMLSRREAGERSEMLSYDRIWPELWVHLYSPRRGFIPVCYISQTEGRILANQSFESRRPLNLGEIETPAHHAALHSAQMIGVPAFVEGR